MGIELDPHTMIVVVSAIGAELMFVLVAFILAGSTESRRHKRRLNSVQDRAQGVASTDPTAARSLARQQSATPKMDRLARNWLPRRDILLARLMRTGRAISIGQYWMASAGLSAISVISLAVTTRIGFVPSLMLGLLIGIALPHKVIGRMGKRRVAKFIALFPDAIDLIVRALRSGLPV